MNRLVLEYLRDPKQLHFSSEPIVGPDEHDDPMLHLRQQMAIPNLCSILLGIIH
jgi:hypothetical protein